MGLLGQGFGFGGLGGGGGGGFWDTFTGDDFTGNNGDPLDTVVWTDQAQAFEWLIQSNKANTNLTAGSSSGAQSKSTFTLSGDFNIQIDFDSAAFTGDGQIRLYILNAGNTYGAFVGPRFDVATHRFHANLKIANNWQTTNNINRTNDWGKVKIYRTGTSVFTQYRDGAGAFTTLKSGVIDATDMHVWLLTGTGGSPTDRSSGNFDNFLINSGTVVPPV